MQRSKSPGPKIDPQLQAMLTVADSDRADSSLEDGVFKRALPNTGNYFSDPQRRVLDAVLLRLFPDDGNGPCARDLNALSYLEWSMTDPVNLRDGDPARVSEGIGWLQDLCLTTHETGFVDLNEDQQQSILERVARSKAGKSWLSLLMFYLTEALMLDPYYGGNPDMVGWLWLEHRPGFPRPVPGKGCRDFE